MSGPLSSGVRESLTRFDARPVPSLDASRAHRTPLLALATSETIGAGLVAIESAITQHFPFNVFADLDLVARVIARRSEGEGDPAARAYADRIAAVHHVFGSESALRFRYVHDFLYGFDWARWVARAPETRRDVGPYDDAFLDYSLQRAAELARLVAEDDPKYGRIAEGTHRNPFPFRRDPEAEIALHQALAASELVPVRAWDPEAPPVWDRPFTALREGKARELGLSLPD